MATEPLIRSNDCFNYRILTFVISQVEFNGVPPSKLKFANYAGTGRIVAIIVRSLTSSASYVPTLSYGCNTLVSSVDDELYSCEVLGTNWICTTLAMCVVVTM